MGVACMQVLMQNASCLHLKGHTQHNMGGLRFFFFLLAAHAAAQQPLEPLVKFSMNFECGAVCSCPFMCCRLASARAVAQED